MEVLADSHRFRRHVTRFEVGHLAPRHTLTYGVDPPHTWLAVTVGPAEGGSVMTLHHSRDSVTWTPGAQVVTIDPPVRVSGFWNGNSWLLAPDDRLYVSFDVTPPQTTFLLPAFETDGIVITIVWQGGDPSSSDQGRWSVVTDNQLGYLLSDYDRATNQFGFVEGPTPVGVSAVGHQWNGIRFVTVGRANSSSPVNGDVTVGVATQGSNVRTTLDGVTWAELTDIVTPLGRLEPDALVWNGDFWIVAGHVQNRVGFAAAREATIHFDDGRFTTEWRVRGLDGRELGVSTPPSPRIRTLDWNGEYHVAGGEQSELYYSRKGIEWSRATLPDRTADAFRDLHWNGRWWTAAWGDKVLHSRRGVAWQYTEFHRDLPESLQGHPVLTLAHTDRASRNVTSPPQVWLGTSPAVVSTDLGVSWTPQPWAAQFFPSGVTIFDGAFDFESSVVILATSAGMQRSFFVAPEWTVVSPFVANVVVFANGTWVAGGSGILFSSDATTWTRAVTPTLNITSIASSGQSFVAVAVGTRILLISPDGRSWESPSRPFIGPQETLVSVSFVDDFYLLATTEALYALDATGTQSAVRAPNPPVIARAVAGNGSGRLVAAGVGELSLAYSDDAGATWLPTLGATFDEGNDVDFVVGGGWVAVGMSQDVNISLTSQDGITWTQSRGTDPGNRLFGTFAPTGYLLVRQEVDIPARSGQSVHHVSDQHYSGTLFTISATLSE